MIAAGRSHGTPVILASLAAALSLTIVPFPDWLAPARPEWTALVLIYWCMALPARVGVGVAWTVGLLQDVMQAGLLGQHALSFAVIAYLTLQSYRRIRVFPPWQQALSVLVMISVHLVLLLWIKGFTGHPPQPWTYWLPSLSSALIWPPLFVALRALRRRFKIA